MKKSIDKNLPFVTIVTPSYNHAKYIRQTIDSILSQDYPNIELVVLNDSSTDETQDILTEYGDQFYWETQPELFQTASINKGWVMTKGEIVTWLNSDDSLYPGAISKSVEYLMKNPDTGIIFGDTMYTEADGKEIYRSELPNGFNYFDFVVDCVNLIPQPSAFIRRDVINKIGYLDPQLDYFMDWDFWLRAGLHFKIDYFPELLSTYRLHENSKTVSRTIEAAPELEILYKKFFSYDNIPDDIRAVENRAMMNMCFTTGGFYLEGNDVKNASKMATQAFKYNPVGMFRPSNLHKFFYCKFGKKSIYDRSRAFYNSFLIR